MIFAGRTRAVADKLLRDIRKVAFWISLSVQILFLAYYGWSIYNSIDSLPFLIIYSCLALVAIGIFVNFFIEQKHKEKKYKIASRILRIAKYIINGVTIGLNAYQLFSADARSDLQIILLGISALSWVANILIEIIRAAVEKYFELFSIAIEKDFALLLKGTQAKGNFFELIGKPIGAIANKISGQEAEIAPAEAEVAELTRAYEEQHKEENKQTSNERAENGKKQIKEHWQTIVNAVKEKMKRKKKK